MGAAEPTGDPYLDRRLEPELHGALYTYAPCLDYSKGAGDLLNIFGDSITDPDKYEEVLEQIGNPLALAVAAALHIAEGEWGDAFEDIAWMATGLFGQGGFGKPSTGPISHITPPSGTPAGALTKATQAATRATPSLDALSQAAGVADRGGLTAAGRSLTKHGAGARPGNTLFPAAKGNPATINQTAQNVVDDILTTPGSTIQNSTRGRFGSTIEVTAPDARGIVYDANGKFLFFKE